MDNSQLSTLNCQLSTLNSLGEDGLPIYAEEFVRLNIEVSGLADELFPLRGENPEAEALLCITLLMAYSAVIYNPADKEEKKQVILNRAASVLDELEASLLKCRLLLYCYGEVFERELLEQAREIMISWGGRELTEDEKEMLEVHNYFVSLFI